MNVRPVQPADAPAITAIYNHYIENTVISFEEVPLTPGEMEQRIRAYTVNYPWLVAEQDNQLVGYAYANQWQVRCAYRQCVETTVYLGQGESGRGYGAALYRELLTALQQRGLHTAIAGIALPNEPSVRLHEKCGFRKVAHFSEVGYKFDRWVDVGYWQKHLASA